jgi:hypothetical protein
MCGTAHGPFLIVARPDDTFQKLLELITEHGRGSHSSTKSSRLSLSTFCGIRWLVSVTKRAAG